LWPRKISTQVRTIVIVTSLVAIVIGTGLALDRQLVTTLVTAQGGQTIETVGLESQLKANVSKTFGPIPATSGSWFGVSASSNKSISFQIRSNSTGTRLNQTSTEFDTVVLVYNSTDYYVTITNLKGATAAVTGNVTLVVLATIHTPITVAKRPTLIPGAALTIFAAITFLYTVVPRNSTKRRSYDRLFP